MLRSDSPGSREPAIKKPGDVQMRNVQHKKEAFWFYRFLSIFYDNFVNPFFWTERMRLQSLELAELCRPDLRTIDVGSGTGFTTEGIVEKIAPEQITCLDQSPHQMAKAKKKATLKKCHFQLGDAEELPFPTDHFDRYISAGSIEYWPEPLRGISEAYRVLKAGGVALLIGPLRPRNRFSRLIADTWMLFPEEADYEKWFRKAGFTNIRKRYVAPHWVVRERYALAIAGSKPEAGLSPAKPGSSKIEDVSEPMSLKRASIFLIRLLIGNIAGFLFIPMAVVARFLRPLRGSSLKTARHPGESLPETLTLQQKVSFLAIGIVMTTVIFWLIFC